MDTIEKINSIFASIRNGLSKALDFIIKIKDILWVVLVLIVSFSLISQCKSNNELEKEVDILTNNTYALTDSLHQYQDELGNVIAEKHALQLTQEEMERTIGELKQKNTEYIAYINTHISLKDTVYIETVIKEVVTDTTKKVETGTIHLEKTDKFKNSQRFIAADIPYTASYPSNLVIEEAMITMSQDLFVEGTIVRNNKTKETIFYLKTDYPGVIFNSGNAIVATNGKQYDVDARRCHGIGLAIGPSLGVYYDNPTQSLKPAVGVTITIGYTYTPRRFQW